MRSISILGALAAFSSSTVLAVEHGGAHRLAVRADAAEATTTSSHGAVVKASSATAVPTAKPKANAAAETTPLPLISAIYSYKDIPYKVNPYVLNDPDYRGPQSGYNQCNSTTAGQDSLCQTLIANSIDDFCVWGAPATTGGQHLGDDEAASVSWCLNGAKWGARTIPPGTFSGLQFMRTSAYIQWTGVLDITKLNYAADDSGGETDPFGADLLGNPLGGLVYSTGLVKGNSTTLTQVGRWNQFLDGTIFCLKLCTPYTTTANYCENRFDLLGCRANMPAAYQDGVFEECEGDVQDVVGVYSVGGVTSTYSQPREGAISLPYTPRIPASSNCVTRQSTDFLGVATTSSATSTQTSASSSVTAANAGAGSSRASSASSAATASPTSAAGALTVGSTLCVLAVAGALLALA